LKIISAVTALILLALPALADFQAGKDAYDAGDFATAMEVWRPLADNGDAFAQEKLGDLYANGSGVPQDYAEAMLWYHLAADQNDPFAQVDLGSM
jgi:TPR repeat protein